MVTTMPPEQKQVGKSGWGDNRPSNKVLSIKRKYAVSSLFLEISLVDCLKACDEIELWTKSTFLQTYVLLPAKRRSLNIEIFNKNMQVTVTITVTYVFSSQPKGYL